MPGPPFHVTLTDDAAADLEAIGDYVAYYGSNNDAIRLLDRIEERIDSLEHFPMRGNVPKELESLGTADYRQSIVGPYRIFYRVDGDEVTIALIADCRRDMGELLRARLLSA